MKSLLDLKKLVNSCKLLQAPFDPGPTKENSNVLELKEDTEDIKSKTSSALKNAKKKLKPQVNQKEETSVMPESLAIPKRKIWIPSVSSSDLNTLITNASETLAQASISKGKGFCPFWTPQVGEISEKLSSLTETDYADSDLKLLNDSYKLMAGKSWFSITTSCPPNKSSSKIFSQSLQSSVPDCTVCEVTHSKDKLGVRQKRTKPNLTGKKYKTLKVRIFPTKEQEAKLVNDSSRLRWYENAYNNIFPLAEYMKLVDKAKEAGDEFAPSINWKTFQSKLKDYEYIEEKDGNILFCQLKLKEGCKDIIEERIIKEEEDRKKNEEKKRLREEEKKNQKKIEKNMSKAELQIYRSKLKEEKRIFGLNKKLQATEERRIKEEEKRENNKEKKRLRDEENKKQKKAEKSMSKAEIQIYRSKLREEKRIFELNQKLQDKSLKLRNTQEYPCPPWMEDTYGQKIDSKTSERIIRGAVANFTQNLNSAVSNYFNDNIKSFDLKYRTAKDKHEFIYFSDEQHPTYYNGLKGCYSYRFAEGHANKRRTSISWIDLLQIHKSSFTIIQDKQSKNWYGCLPVERDWYPPFAHNSENQGLMKRGEAIGLDPGMRKFLSGFTTTGETIYFGDRAFNQISPLYLEIGKIDSKLTDFRNKQIDLTSEEKDKLCKLKQRLWRRVKDLVTELHWKCIRFLVLNYEYIFLEDFSTKDCIKKKSKGKDLDPFVKRILGQYSFYKFKQRLAYYCDKYGSKLILVHPARTTSDCPFCGHSQDIKKSETYNCPQCNRTLDRDEHSALNVLVKGMSILERRN